MTSFEPIGASFRDPSGTVFAADGVIYRQVNRSYQKQYDQLMQGGLYADLLGRGLLISHEEVGHELLKDPGVYKVLQPRQLRLVSYPYEWSFSQLQDAALLTLDVQRRCLAHDMILKDASAYNVQFLAGKALFIDSLSFERYQPGQAWHAYEQFCQHFLAPLALMSFRDVRLSQLLRVHLDGIPLDLAVALLPRRSWLNFGLGLHLRLHARAQRRYRGAEAPAANARRKRLSKKDLLNIAKDLRSTIAGLRWDYQQTDWAGYYAGDSYQEGGFTSKRQLVSDFIDRANPSCLWDLGANTGVFSRIASQRGIYTVSLDSDPGAVEANYRQARQDKDAFIQPLLIDLSNPSAAIGWANSERDGLRQRCQADCLLALALVHHLAISNNLPLGKIASYFASMAEWLIIEFVPKADKKVQQLLAAREDIFTEYSQSGFERAFAEAYEIVQSAAVEDSARRLYLLRRR